MWNKNEVDGKIEQAKGKAKQAVGDATNDPDLIARRGRRGCRQSAGHHRPRVLARWAKPSRKSAKPSSVIFFF